MGYVNHAKNPNVTWHRLWEMLIDYIDHDLEDADIAYVKESLAEMMSKTELKELGIWDWLGFEEECENDE